MRRKLVEADLLECVLGLGPNLFYNSPMEACVVVCRSRKTPHGKGKILFINAVNEVTRERAQSFLQGPSTWNGSVAACAGFAEAPGFAHVATIQYGRCAGAAAAEPVDRHATLRTTEARGRGGATP